VSLESYCVGGSSSSGSSSSSSSSILDSMQAVDLAGILKVGRWWW